MSRTHWLLVLAGILAGWVLLWPASLPFAWAQTASPPASAPATGPAVEMDAQYVRMEIPQKVLAGQVFLAKITMKNTGSLAWKEVWREAGTLTTMISQDPEGNMTWGAGHIIQGQGTNIEPGKEFTYTSFLKAPAAPGKYGFQWRLQARGAFFGQPTERATIIVEARPEAASRPATLPAPEDGRRALTLDDFEYMGSFKVPATAGAGGAGFSALGMTLRILPDGQRRLLLNYTHPAQSLAEIDVPEPVKLAGKGDLAELKVPEVKKVWGAIGLDVPKTGDVSHIGPNGGLWWDEQDKTLYWTWYHGYWTGGALPILAASKLGDDGKITHSGPWTALNMKHHWGGVIGLPKGFADKYAGGRPMALGFGGYYSICGPCSRGPALGAIARPDVAAKEVDLLPLVAYAGTAKAPRDGDYFSANCGYWNDPPEGPDKGTWAAFDECFAGVFIELPDSHAYIAFANLASGRIGYDYGAGTTGGRAQYWYFYSPADLGASAKGAKKPGEVVPYLMAKDGQKAGGPALLGGSATGACFDAQQRRLYVVRTWAYPVGKESHPLIHVYQVKR